MSFYDNLTESGIFFFWIVILLVIFLMILAVILLKKNKKLRELINNNYDSCISVPPVTEEVDDSIINVNEQKVVTEAKKEFENIEIKMDEEVHVKDVIKEEVKIEETASGPYQKNVLREMSRNMTISPICIEKRDIDDANMYTLSSEDDEYEIDEMYLREESVSPLEEMDDFYEINDNMRFANDIVSRMEEEIKPSNIELTDYEKKEEEEAIISYDELQKVKDKIYNITEDEENDEFIDELKSFRLDLQ